MTIEEKRKNLLSKFSEKEKLLDKFSALCGPGLLPKIKRMIYPKASIIIPTYNRKAFLKDCLLSLFKQSCPKDKYEIMGAARGKDTVSLYINKKI